MLVIYQPHYNREQFPETQIQFQQPQRPTAFHVFQASPTHGLHHPGGQAQAPHVQNPSQLVQNMAVFQLLHQMFAEQARHQLYCLVTL